MARTAKDPNGRTCLHLSAMHGHYECLEYLVDNGSDLDTVDIDGRTALMYAAMEARNVNSLGLYFFFAHCSLLLTASTVLLFLSVTELYL